MAVKKYQAFSNFTAQGKNVSALMGMYSQLDSEHWSRVELAPVVVFIAFSIESYLNSIGARHINFWDEIERSPWKSKVIILHKAVGKNPDWSKDPLQFAIEAFSLRDKLAHGRPEQVLGQIHTDPRQADRELFTQSIQPEWFKKLDREWVIEAKDRFHNLMVYLASLYGLHESDHLNTASGGIRTIEE